MEEEDKWKIVDDLKEDIKPYENLWNLYHDYKEKYEEQWQKGRLGDLVPDTVEEDYKRMLKDATSLSNAFEKKKLPKPQKVANKMADDLRAFRSFLPIIRALCEPGL
jgi:hypothetical protein